MRDQELTKRAKNMRANASEPEQRMWLAPRAGRLAGIKFRRQKVIGPYIVDFASRTPMLVIEIDGDTHGAMATYDARRTVFLECRGYRVLRFSNVDVMNNFEGVLTIIGDHLSPLPTLSPEGERA